MSKNKKEIDMLNSPVLPSLLELTVPLVLSSVLQLLFNAADVIVVGNFAGQNSLAAVGSTTALVNLMTNLFLGLSVSVNVLTARFSGAGNSRQISRTIHTAVSLSAICGLILMTAGILLAPDLLKLMKTPDDVLPLSSLYLRIYFTGMIPMMIYNFGSSILRSKGDTRRPLLFLTAAGVVNVILNLIFVIALKMDVMGVGLATAISHFISASLILVCLSREEGDFRFSPKKLILDPGILAAILKIGIPAGIQGVIFSLSNVVIQSSINSFGNIVMAGSAAASSIEGFVWVSMNAFSQSALTFMSQNIGAGKYSRMNKITVQSCICAAATGIIMGNTAFLLSRQLLAVYNSNPEVIEAGRTRLMIVCCTYCTCGLMDCIVGNIRGMGYAMTPTVISLIGACGLRIIWIFTVFQLPQFHTEEFLFASYPVSWILTFSAHIICYRFMRKKYPYKDRKPKENEPELNCQKTV